jgi:hypothetical protein
LSGETYRWWVRGLDAGGNGLPWSQPLDFRVVSADSLDQPDGDSPLVTADAVLAADIDLNTIFTTAGPAVADDGFRSLAVHSSGVVMQIDPEVTRSMDIPAAVESKATENVAEIDALMADFLASGTREALAGFEAMPAAPDVAMSVPVEPAARSQTSARTGVLAMLAGLVVSRKVRRTDEEGACQRLNSSLQNNSNETCRPADMNPPACFLLLCRRRSMLAPSSVT